MASGVITVRKHGLGMDFGLQDGSPLPGFVMDAVCAELTYNHKQFLRGHDRYMPDGSIRNVKIETRRLYDVIQNRVLTGFGFMPRVYRVLQSFGYTLTFTDLIATRPRQNCYEPNLDIFQKMSWRPRQDECVRAIMSSPGGIISAPPAFGKSEVIARVAKMYPEAKFAVVTKRKDVAQSIYRRCFKYLPEVGFVGDGHNTQRRVTIYIAKSMHKADPDVDFLLADECITGDAEIATETGTKLLKDIVVGDNVMCYDGTKVVLRPVTKIWSQGKRNIMRLRTKHGELRCTENHPVYTRRGWINAGQLLLTDEILSLVPADVEQKSQTSIHAISVDTLVGINQNASRIEHIQTGLDYGKKHEPNCHSVLVDVDNSSISPAVQQLTNLSCIKDVRNTAATLLDTERGRQSMALYCLNLNDKQYSALLPAIAASPTQMPTANVQDLCQTTDYHKNSGRCIKPINLKDSGLTSISDRITATVTTPLQVIVGVYLRCAIYMRLFIRRWMALSVLQRNGWTSSVQSDLPGGFATTDRPENTQCDYIQKGTTSIPSTVSNIGLANITDQLRHVNEIAEVGICTSPETVETHFTTSACTNTYQNVCNTNFVPLIMLERLSNEENVYDIEVAECHNFFANGLLVHNCHELVSDHFCETMIRAFNNARCYGFSATWDDRPDGTSARIEHMFGPVIFDMSWQEATQLGLIVPVDVHWLNVIMDRNPCEKYTQDIARKRHGIWRNNIRNSMFAEAARKYSADEQTLILVETVEHAVMLHKYLPEFEMCYGDMEQIDLETYKCHGLLDADYEPLTAERRDVFRQRFEANDLKKVIATDVWSTGVSFEQLAVLMRADARSSAILDDQAPGRVVRTHAESGKQKGIVYDAYDMFDTGFKRKSQEREKRYKAKGWAQIRPRVLEV